MTLEDLMRRFRVLARDEAQPQKTSDQSLIDWLNDAQRQACIRGRLLLEDARESMCRITLVEGKAKYKLHPKLYELVTLSLTSPHRSRQFLKIKSREWLNENRPDWRDCPRYPEYVIQDELALTIVGKFPLESVLHVEGYRLPLEDMEDGADEPEIHEAHHEHLVQWALFRAFSVPDSELFDPNRAALAEQQFTRYFGKLPDSDMRRITREDVVHRNIAILP